MPASPEQQGGEPPAETVADFFRQAVVKLFKDNAGSVMTKEWGPEQTVAVLHLIDPHPPAGEQLEYHHVYTSLNEPRDRLIHGISIARPTLFVPDAGGIYAWRGYSRHYYSVAEGSTVVREDKLYKETYSKYLKTPENIRRKVDYLSGAAIRAAEVSDDSDQAALLNELHNDILKLESSQAIRPMTLLFRPSL